MKKTKKIVSMVLATMLAVGAMVVPVSAAETVHTPATLTTNLGELEFTVGETKEFTYTTTANDDAGVMVVGTSDMKDPNAHVEYYETNPENEGWKPLNGDFGPSTGFPMTDATSKFRVTFDKAGDYTFTVSMKKVEDGSILCSAKTTVTVVDPVVEPPVEPEKKTFTVTNNTAADANGTVTVSETVVEGETLAMTVTPKEGFVIDTLMVNDKNVTDQIVDGIYKMENVTSDVVVVATFKEKPAEKIMLGSMQITMDVPVIGKELATTSTVLVKDVNGAEVGLVCASGDVAMAWTANNTTVSGKAEAGKAYTVNVTATMNLTNCAVSENFVVLLNGEKVDHKIENAIVTFKKDFAKLEEEKPVAPTYEITDGKNAEWKDNSEVGQSFSSTAPYNKFESVKMDGKPVEGKHYTVKEGSTIVTFTKEYLKSLEPGKHTVTIVSKDGEASADFTIMHVHVLKKVDEKKATCTEKGVKKHYECDCGKWYEDEKGTTEITDKDKMTIAATGHKKSNKWSSDKKQHWHECTVCGEPVDEKEDHEWVSMEGKDEKYCKICKYNPDSPQTGDQSHMGMWIAGMSLAVAVIAGTTGYYFWDKKRKA